MDVITIGDAMVSMQPQTEGPMRFVNAFDRKAGGAEFNLAIGCARLGLRTTWVSRLGNDEFGRFIRNFARGEGVDTSEVKLVDGYPTSVQFKEVYEGGGGQTFYYRSNSPTSTLTEEAISASIFNGGQVLHITGVFMALDKKKNVPIIKKAIRHAKEQGLFISLDPNIRLKLWEKEEAREALLDILPEVDLLLAGVEEAEILFNSVDPDIIFQKCRALGLTSVVLKDGENGSIGWENGETIISPAVKAQKVVDTVGAGDGFDAGYLYSWLQGWTLEKRLHMANTIGSMVVGVSGDNEGLPYLDEVLIQLGEKEFIER
ncbi:2-keto-3-deoxygluconate kinase [Alteribacter lacisalsi]|uniref:2-keto-3-deoxygluconate kinase n=1 Tax=Alteribacter lacisalsi TaxID=2045244 RepID=A0A2W0H2H9_9BACI|nr:sugar kinase [Alteribacter lacisalsi]PYZ95993.1 2-keto-3-deoxygluconate kinase [Alteribacter lacisalsi]